MSGSRRVDTIHRQTKMYKVLNDVHTLVSALSELQRYNFSRHLYINKTVWLYSLSTVLYLLSNKQN